MGVMIEIKRGERLYIGNAIVMTQDARSRLHIEGDAPILREKDVMTPDQANTLAKRLYFVVQQIYMSQHSAEHFGAYKFAVQDFAAAQPNERSRIVDLGALLETGELFKALRLAKQFVEEERLAAPPIPEKPAERARKIVPGASTVSLA